MCANRTTNGDPKTALDIMLWTHEDDETNDIYIITRPTVCHNELFKPVTEHNTEQNVLSEINQNICNLIIRFYMREIWDNFCNILSGETLRRIVTRTVSVCLSVCLCATDVYCAKTVQVRPIVCIEVE